MASGRSIKLTGAVGEFLVAAELCRKGLLATPFAGNVPHYDIIASGQRGGHVPIQVKTINAGTWQFDIRRYLDVRLDEDGRHQRIGRSLAEPFSDLVNVLVVLKGGTQSQDRDRFFILDWKELRNTLIKGYKRFLAKHDFARPNSPESFHTALTISEIEQFEDQWDKIKKRIPVRYR